MKTPLLFVIVCGCTALSAATITVTSTADAADPAPGTLRYAINNAQDGDTIVFDESLSGQTISIYDSPNTAHVDTSFQFGDKSLTVIGPTGGVTIDGGWNQVKTSDSGSRIFAISGEDTTNVIKNIVFYRGHGRNWINKGGYMPSGGIFTLGNVRLYNCTFLCNSISWSTTGTTANGGAAVYAERGVEAYNCNFYSNQVYSSTSYGTLFNISGNAIISNCLFQGNYSGSYGGAIALYNGGLTVVDSLFQDNVMANDGGDIHVLNSARGPIFIKDSAFRNSYCEGGSGGSIYFNSQASLTLTLINSEFSGSSCGSNGGAIRTGQNGNVSLRAINCTFANCVGKDWGAVLDLRASSFLVNCTVTGTADIGSQSVNQNGCVVFFNNNSALLNTVELCNSLHSLDSSFTLSRGVAKYASTEFPFQIINTIANNLRTDRTTPLEVSTDSIFADPFVVTNVVNYLGSTRTLYQNQSFPVFAADPKNKYRSRVIAPAKGGLLDGTGYPVKANADYSFVAYSTDNGSTWTTLYGVDDGTAQLITKDQRGVRYYKGKTPIGAATVAVEPSGLILVVH